MSEKERIEQIISVEGITSGEFAKEIGVQTSTVSHIITERNRPSLHVMRKILKRYPNINSDWLILGQGEMLRDKSQPRAPKLFMEDDETHSKSDGYDDIKPVIKDLESQPTVIKQHESPTKVFERAEETPITLSAEDMFAYQSLMSKQATQADKKIERIIIYFTDNTFQEFESK